MACTVVRSGLLRGSTVRHYGAASAAQSAVASTPDCQVLSNKITVAAQDNNSGLAQVSIVFRAGSRNECYNTQGVTHHLRLAAGLSTSELSTFAITKSVIQKGGILTATADRESIAYTLLMTRDTLSDSLSILENVATKQQFRPWELAEEIPRMKYELASLPDSTLVLELLHKAAFCTGLGYSLYSPEYNVGRIGTETLQHFVNTWFTAPNCAIVGTGVPLSELTALANNLKVGSESRSAEASRYIGGQIREEKSSNLTNVAIAVEGVSSKNEKDALASAILQRATDGGPRVKWGGSSSPLNKNLSSIAGSEPLGVATINANYSDSGLFGVSLCSTPSIAGALTKAAASWLKNMKISDSDVARGKALLKAEILNAADNVPAQLENLQYQAISRGKVSSVASVISEVDKISASDVKSLADKLSKGSLSLAAVGDLQTVPTVNELK